MWHGKTKFQIVLRMGQCLILEAELMIMEQIPFSFNLKKINSNPYKNCQNLNWASLCSDLDVEIIKKNTILTSFSDRMR